MTENRKQEAAEKLAELLRHPGDFPPAAVDVFSEMGRRRRAQQAKDGEGYDGGGTPIRGLKAAFSDDRITLNQDITRED